MSEARTPLELVRLFREREVAFARAARAAAQRGGDQGSLVAGASANDWKLAAEELEAALAAVPPAERLARAEATAGGTVSVGGLITDLDPSVVRNAEGGPNGHRRG